MVTLYTRRELFEKVENIIEGSDSQLPLENLHFPNQVGLPTNQKNNYKADINQEAKEEDPTYDLILQWLATLKLLEKVPFNYLIPNEEMLPPESIRFFYINKNWVSAVIDGAYSIGGTTRSDIVHNDLFKNSIDNDSYVEADSLRGKSFKKKESNQTEEKLNNINRYGEAITGFILRSKLISNWPTLEVRGYTYPLDFNQGNIGSPDLKILRMEHLASDILLCIFDNKIGSVLLSAPCESIHFGFESKNGVLTKTLRDKNGGQKKDTQDKLIVNNTFFRKDTETSRVLRISKLAEQIKLKTNYNSNLLLSSSQFAMQMITGVDSGVISIKSTNI